MFVGIIELGVDFARLSIYKFENKEFHLVLDKQSPTGFLYFAQDGMLTLKGIANTIVILKDFKTIQDGFGIQQQYAFASATVTNFSNYSEFLQQFGNATGRAFDVLSSDEEAEFSFSGSLRETGWASGLFVGVGGASIDLVEFSEKEITRTVRIPYGALSLALKYARGITLHKSNILEIKQNLKRDLKRTKIFECADKSEISASGDAVESALKLYNDIFELNDGNRVMESTGLCILLAKYNEDRRDFTRRINQIVPESIQTVIPGVIILSMTAVMSRSGNIEVCCTGIREEYLRRYAINKTYDTV